MTTRFADPVVEEVRAARKSIIQACEKEHTDYYTHLLALQERYRGRTVSFSPKPDAEQRKSAGA